MYMSLITHSNLILVGQYRKIQNVTAYIKAYDRLRWAEDAKVVGSQHQSISLVASINFHLNFHLPRQWAPHVVCWAILACLRLNSFYFFEFA